MTIEELKLNLNDIKLVIPMTKKTIDMAIDIICKYQKIKHILKYDWDNGYQHSETINRIKEVLEDGHND